MIHDKIHAFFNYITFIPTGTYYLRSASHLFDRAISASNCYSSILYSG